MEDAGRERCVKRYNKNSIGRWLQYMAAHGSHKVMSGGENLAGAPRAMKNSTTGGVDESTPAPAAGTIVRDAKTGRLYKWDECPMADVTKGTADNQDKAKVGVGALETGAKVGVAVALHKR